MYSEHGLLALIRAVFGQVCQSLMVVSNCMPGSPQIRASLPRSAASGRAPCRCAPAAPSRTALVVHSPSSSTARMNSSVTRTLLFEFWKNTDAYAGPVNEPS